MEALMTRSARQRLHVWYGIFLAIFTVVIAVLFAAQAADIYFSGAGYSRELVAERVSALAVPFWLWVAAIIAGGILTMVFPPEKSILQRIPDERKTVQRLIGMAGTSSSEKYIAAEKAVKKESKIRTAVRIGCFVVCLVCAIVALAFVFNFPAYPSDATDAVLMLVRSVLPCAAVAFLACLGASVFDTISAKRILPQAKLLLADGGRAKAAPGCKETALDSLRFLLVARIAVLLIAAAFIIWGILNGGADELLAKAVAICTECIGLG